MQLTELLITGLIVGVATVYVSWALAPRRLRTRAGPLAGHWASSRLLPAGLRSRLSRFAAAQTRPSGCGACSHRAPRVEPHQAPRRATRYGRT